MRVFEQPRSHIQKGASQWKYPGASLIVGHRMNFGGYMKDKTLFWLRLGAAAVYCVLVGTQITLFLSTPGGHPYNLAAAAFFAIMGGLALILVYFATRR